MYDPDAHRYDCVLGDVPMMRKPRRPSMEFDWGDVTLYPIPAFKPITKEDIEAAEGMPALPPPVIPDPIVPDVRAPDHPLGPFPPLRESDDITPINSAAWRLRRLLILNDYGFTVEHHFYGPKDGSAGESFLSDEWLRSWYGEGVSLLGDRMGLPDYVWEALRDADE